MPLVVKQVSGCTAQQAGTLTNGSPIVTGLSDTSLLQGALRASGTGVPLSTFVASIDSPTQITLTQPATSSGTPTLTFSIEPVSLAEAQLHLRGAPALDAPLIARNIVAARRLCEVIAKRSFLISTFDLVDDAFPGTGGYLSRDTRLFYGQFNGGQGLIFPGALAANAGIITLPRAPLVSVVSVGYLDTSGNPQVLDPSLYTVLTGSPGRLSPVFGQIWPTTLPQIGSVTIRFTAGYGTDSSAVPDTDQSAILLALGHLYENREAVLVGSGASPLPMGVMHLLGVEDNTGGYS